MTLRYLIFGILLVQAQSHKALSLFLVFLLAVSAEKLDIEWATEQESPVPTGDTNLQLEIFCTGEKNVSWLAATERVKDVLQFRHHLSINWGLSGPDLNLENRVFVFTQLYLSEWERENVNLFCNSLCDSLGVETLNERFPLGNMDTTFPKKGLKSKFSLVYLVKYLSSHLASLYTGLHTKLAVFQCCQMCTVW